MAHSHLTPPPGGSVLGPEHERRARQMTGAAALAAAAVCALLGLLCVPLVLVLPVGFVLYVASEAVFAVLYWWVSCRRSSNSRSMVTGWHVVPLT